MEPEELFADDQGVEITNLPGDERRRFRARRAPGALVRRGRLFRWIGIIALGVCCLVLLLRSTPGLSGSLLRGIFGPLPTPATSNGQDIHLFYVNASPPWGILSVDGKKIIHPIDAASRQPLQLAPGSHHLTWQATPFLPQSCIISAPASFQDTCRATGTTLTPTGELAWVISFQDSISTLPPDQQSTLAARIQQELDGLQTSDLVQVGERFLDNPLDDRAPRPALFEETARQTLRATLHLTRPTGYVPGGTCMGANIPNSCEINGQDCNMLCSLGSQGNLWNVASVVATSWTYTTLDGQLVAADMADEYGENIEHLLPLTISWDGRLWHVQAAQQFIDGPIPCVAASDQNALGNTFGVSPFQSFTWNFVPASDIAAGCLIVLTSLVNGGPSPTTSSRIVYLHRFGLFIAINHLAQEYASSAQHPTAYELHLARELAAQGHLSFS